VEIMQDDIKILREFAKTTLAEIRETDSPVSRKISAYGNYIQGRGNIIFSTYSHFSKKPVHFEREGNTDSPIFDEFTYFMNHYMGEYKGPYTIDNEGNIVFYKEGTEPEQNSKSGSKLEKKVEFSKIVPNEQGAEPEQTNYQDPNQLDLF